MAPQPDLAKIGREGFDLIETFHGAPAAPRRPTNGGFNGRLQRQARWAGIQGIQDQYKKEEPVITSKEAVYNYGGINVVSYPKTKPQNRWGNFFKAFKP